mgnify:CR=1 FL=1
MAWPDEKDVRKAILGHKVVFWLYIVALVALGALIYSSVTSTAADTTSYWLFATSTLFPLAIIADFIERTKHFHEVASVKLLSAFVIFLLATYGAVAANDDIGKMLNIDASSPKVSFAALAVYQAVMGIAKVMVLAVLVLPVPLVALSFLSKPLRRFRERRRAQLTEMERNLRVTAPGSGRTRRFRNVARFIAVTYIVLGVLLLDPSGPNHRMLVSMFIVKADFFPNKYCDGIEAGLPVFPSKDGKLLVARKIPNGGYEFSMAACNK